MKTSQRARKTKRTRKTKNKNVIRKYMQTKLAFLFMAITLALFSLCYVLTMIVKADGDKYKQIVLDQQDYSSAVLPYKRGDILDRNGTPLAISERVYNLIIDPKVILSSTDRYKDATLSALTEVFGYDRAELEQLMVDRSSSNYVVYERNLSYDKREAYLEYRTTMNKSYKEANSSQEISLNGVWFEELYLRNYPYSTLASHVIGFYDGENALGGGLEQYYDSVLTGTNGREYGYLNNDAALERVRKPATDGYTIMSTIDINVQNIVERHIAEFMDYMGAERIGVIAMNPNNGEILAMATNGSYDLNNPRDLSYAYSQAEIEAMNDDEVRDALYQMWRNFCVSDTYEPGSTTKPFTIAAALEEGAIGMYETFLCDGYENIGGFTIKCINRYGHGVISVTESLMYSCNDALMAIGNRLGRTQFAKYQRLFGFGRRTGIDLPGEAYGILFDGEAMVPTDLATNSFGQNFTVTMVQMTAGFSSLINGGSYYEPTLVRKIVDSNGGLIESNDSTVVRETVSASTSEFIRQALYMTVENEAGTGKAAHIDGYEMGGKTGTAEKSPRGNGNYLVSFIGMAPYDNPEIVLYVVIDEPHHEYQPSSGYAIRVYRDIMEDILPYVNVFPSIDFQIDETEAEPETTAEPGGEAEGTTNEAPAQDGNSETNPVDDAETETLSEEELEGDDNGFPDSLPIEVENDL